MLQDRDYKAMREATNGTNGTDSEHNHGNDDITSEQRKQKQLDDMADSSDAEFEKLLSEVSRPAPGILLHSTPGFFICPESAVLASAPA